ncbi:hypothetical protein C3Y94_000305 [Rhizobium ruizarguesonis]|uniref:hypothetical protein n=1 Tax=Rhizobium ruizarguesonis TaxID=2081791 RepID=UPI001639F513|nr:hypothetical protein [Rhizobium ruizarguesonis]MBC2801626.1 hypothetical protein [Rhizobium ruizarguesonis]
MELSVAPVIPMPRAPGSRETLLKQLLADLFTSLSRLRHEARALKRVAPDTIDEQHFSTGSMAPKVAAAIQLAKSTGRQAAIGKLGVAATIARGENGTLFDPQSSGDPSRALASA